MMVLIGFPQGIADQTGDQAPLAAARRLPPPRLPASGLVEPSQRDVAVATPAHAP